MGANQGRPSDAKRKSKKAKGKEADAAHHDAKAAGRHPTASPPVVSRASSGDVAARAAAPADHAAPQTKPHAGPAVAPAAAAAVVDPHDEHAHPFHAPLDHVREEERPLQELCAATHFDMTTLRKLQILFSDIAESAIADGFVDGNELTDAMGLKSSCLLARTICRVFDITQKKSIDFAQWVKTISALCPEASLEEKIHFSFSLYDLNGDGFVDVEELQAMLEAAVKDENVLNLSDAEVAEWCAHTLSQVDRDGDGRVDYEEYRSMVSASTKFLESFTLDIQEMCSSFRFASRKSTEKLTAAEQDQRLHWFRARQRQHSQSGNSSHPDDSSNSEHHPKSAVKAPGASATAGNVAAPSGAVAPAGAVAKLKSNSREGGHTTPPYGGSATLMTGSGSYKPIIVTTPAPASSVAQSVPASAITAAAAAACSSHAVSASSHGKGMHVMLGPLHETEADGSASSAAASAAALAASPSAVLSTPGLGSSPTFHDADPSPSPSAPTFTDSPAEHTHAHAHFSSHDSATHQSDTATVTAAAAAGALAVSMETVTISSVAFSLASSSSTSAAAAAAAAAPSSGDDDAAGPASTSRRDSTGAVHTEADAAAAAASASVLAASSMRRQHSAPLSNGAHSIHYVSSRTPLHLLKQASIDTLAHSDDEVEEMQISPLDAAKHADQQ